MTAREANDVAGYEDATTEVPNTWDTPSQGQYLFLAEVGEDGDGNDILESTGFFTEDDEVELEIADTGADKIENVADDDATDSIRTRAFTADTDEGQLFLTDVVGTEAGDTDTTVQYNIDLVTDVETAEPRQFFLIEDSDDGGLDPGDEDTYTARGANLVDTTDDDEELTIEWDFGEGNLGNADQTSGLLAGEDYTVAYREAVDSTDRIMAAAGFEARSPDSVTFESIASVAIASPADGEFINQDNEGAHTVEGTGQDGAEITVVWEDAAGNTVDATDIVDDAATPEWSVSADVSGLDDGDVTITATQDVDGSTDSVTVTKDTDSPTATNVDHTGTDGSVFGNTSGDAISIDYDEVITFDTPPAAAMDVDSDGDGTTDFTIETGEAP
jgi:hypothetical protein